MMSLADAASMTGGRASGGNPQFTGVSTDTRTLFPFRRRTSCTPTASSRLSTAAERPGVSKSRALASAYASIVRW